MSQFSESRLLLLFALFVRGPQWGIDVKDERHVRLDRIAKEEGEAFVYEYDMGDSWRHQVVVEKVGADSSNAKGAVCLSGERACPPEDCGGVHGHYGTLEILRNPRHDEYKHTKTWIESMTGGPSIPTRSMSTPSTRRSIRCGEAARREGARQDPGHGGQRPGPGRRRERRGLLRLACDARKASSWLL